MTVNTSYKPSTKIMNVEPPADSTVSLNGVEFLAINDVKSSANEVKQSATISDVSSSTFIKNLDGYDTINTVTWRVRINIGGVNYSAHYSADYEVDGYGAVSIIDEQSIYEPPPGVTVYAGTDAGQGTLVVENATGGSLDAYIHLSTEVEDTSST